MSARARARRQWGDTVARVVVILLLAFAIFGPLANLVLWGFAERWYFPNKLPQEFGLTFWARVFSPRGGASARCGPASRSPA
jgi:ABC-type spermidine/putrescine transport system permease subunit II